jgi:hypothetical protein
MHMKDIQLNAQAGLPFAAERDQGAMIEHSSTCGFFNVR